MKVVILNHYASIPSFGSAETRHYEIGKRLVEKGHEVSIVVGNYSHLLQRRWTELKDNYFVENGVEYFVVDTREYKSNGVSRFFSSYDYYKNGKKLLLKKPDIIVASSPHPFAWKLGSYYSKKYKVPYVVEIRDIWPDDLIEAGILPVKHIVVKVFDYMCKKYYSKSSGIISLVPDISEHLKRLKIIFEKPIYFIPNGIDTKIFNNVMREDIVDELFNKIPENTIKIVYTGSLGPSNGLDYIVKEIKKLPDNLKNKFSFVFIGAGSKKDELKKIAQSEKNVYFFDPIPKKYIPYLIKEKSDILLFSLSDFNNTKYPAYSSFKLMDYMASGKPILSIYHPGLLLSETEDAIFYIPKKEGSFEKAIFYIFNNLDDVLKMGKKNKEYIEKYRKWDVLVEEFEDILISMLKK